MGSFLEFCQFFLELGERFLAERYGRVETSDGASTDLARPADSQELSADIARYVEIAEAESCP